MLYFTLYFNCFIVKKGLLGQLVILTKRTPSENMVKLINKYYSWMCMYCRWNYDMKVKSFDTLYQEMSFESSTT